MSNTVTKNEIVTGKVRLSYVNLIEPRINDDGKKAYDVSVMVKKDDRETLDKINAAIAFVKSDKASKSKWGGKIPANLKMPLHDGDVDREDDEAYAGCWYFSCKSNRQPGIVGPNLEAIIDPEEIYSGIYAKVNIRFYPYAVSGNGIAVWLCNVQKLADGEPLGASSRKAEDVFSSFEVAGETKQSLNDLY